MSTDDEQTSPCPSTPPHQRTQMVRAGLQTDGNWGAVVPPVCLSTIFTFDGIGGKRKHDYSRQRNPTRDLLADTIAQLEGGAGGVVTGSGLGALLLVFQLLNQGDTILISHDCFGGTYRLAQALADRGHYRVVFATLPDVESLPAIMDAHKPRMMFVETPSNPLLRVTDLSQVIALARARGCLTVVDNTFLSPVQQLPLSFGADFVLHATTKFLNGHSDVVGGAVVAARAEDVETLQWWAGCAGLTGGAFDSYMTVRGLRTLDVRVQRQSDSAGKIARMLSAHGAVDKVYYPGLPDNPYHALAARQQTGFGSLISFEVKGGLAGVKTVCENRAFFSLAESLGGVESLICHPTTMTHASMPESARKEAGISDQLVRLSIGIEACEDLMEDLGGALDRVLRG